MICAHLSDVAIEMTAAQLRAAKVVANRRALASLLHHHGDRPPEAGCSAEALRIRKSLGPSARRLDAPRVAAEPVPSESAKSARPGPSDLLVSNPAIGVALDALVVATAAKHRVPVALLLAPPRRAAQRSVERRAQLANREAMYRAYHELCPHYRALGRHFGKNHSSIRKAAALHAARIGADEGRG